MAPELAVSYVIGWIPSLTLTGVHFHLHRKKLNSPATINLQRNLRQAGLYWNETDSRVQEYKEYSAEKDRAASRRSITLMGTFSFFFSWIGFFFHLLILLSIQVLAVSRLEKALYSSELAQREVSPTELQNILQDLKERDLIK